MNRRTFFKFFAGAITAAAALPFLPKFKGPMTATEVLERQRDALRRMPSLLDVFAQVGGDWVHLVEERDYKVIKRDNRGHTIQLKQAATALRIHQPSSARFDAMSISMYSTPTNAVRFVAHS